MADTVAVKSNALPLPLAQKISEQPPSKGLPLTLNRKLGTLVPFVKRLMQGASLTFTHTYQSPTAISNSLNSQAQALALANTLQTLRQMGQVIGGNYLSQLQPFFSIANDISAKYGSYTPIDNRFMFNWLSYIGIANTITTKASDTVSVASVVFSLTSGNKLLDNSVFDPLQATINLSDGVANNQHGALVGNRHESRTQATVPVPCRYYPIPEALPPPAVGVCDIRPPSSRLPLSLNRKRGGIPSDKLPLPLMCWNHQSPEFIPDLRSYIVLNTVTATIGGIVIDPIDFDFKCDMSGYCWQGGINISDGQYQKIRAKLDVERGNEPTVTVNVNGALYSFIAEDITRNRKFVNYTYNLSGRSITARLGADYAHAQGGINGVDGGVIAQDLYASQIVQMQLADTGITLNKWDVADWLIPANTYSVAGKTPLAVIGDIAKACGGFVYSDPVLPKLSILPRWRKSAWELATATPDLVVPTGVMSSISDKKRVNPRYNTVYLIGSHSANIYRNLQGMDRQAPIDSNVLYTDRDCVVVQGQAILSDSGTHIDYSITMRQADKYNIPLAMPSAIWQVSDPDPQDRAWNGIVQGVSLSVGRDDGAITVWQNVAVDRYFDN